jgi:hypothetical protein
MTTQVKRETSFVTKVIVIAVAIGGLITLLTPNTDKLSRFDTQPIVWWRCLSCRILKRCI